MFIETADKKLVNIDNVLKIEYFSNMSKFEQYLIKITQTDGREYNIMQTNDKKLALDTYSTLKRELDSIYKVVSICKNKEC